VPSCERCWNHRHDDDDYYRVMADAERDGLECTKDTIEGARLRAGQWWDEATQRDTRVQITPEGV
jgi:hypothetical protein